MPNSNSKYSEVDRLLEGLIKEGNEFTNFALIELFEKRLESLEIPISTAAKILGVENRALNGVLKGSQKQIDFTILIKLANFLQISNNEVISKYLDALEKNFNVEFSYSPEKINFIKSHFDLPALRKVGFINSISDYEHIEIRIKEFFGFKYIFEYAPANDDIAFSAGKVHPKSDLTRKNWIFVAKTIFKRLDNPNSYNREKLIEYFPEIRRHSKNVEHGLKDVIQTLYGLGITVIYQDSLPSLHLRGATFAVNEKPCIVLTNYKGFYPTLWFALVHELFHVLFDWGEILENKYHLSNEENTKVSVIEKEAEADEFARAYLFSIEKTDEIKKYIHNHDIVKKFASNNDIHYSFIYVFFANDMGNQKGIHWSRAHKYNPDIDKLLDTIGYGWDKSKSIDEIVKALKNNIFN